MLVLRRRSQEVIVFEGGLTLTLIELVERHAWLGFEAPSFAGMISIAPLAVTDDTVSLGIRSPLSLTYGSDSTQVTLDPSRPVSDSSSIAVLRESVGGRISFDGMELHVASIAQGRAGLRVEVPCIGRPITVSVQSISGLEARIGIDAPDDLRVMRKELWLDLLDANQGASRWSRDEMDSLRSPSETDTPN